MWSRNTGISATAQPQQLPPPSFKPKSEWKHEGETSFLFVYLPGFVMEQLKITTDYSNRTVKVEGTRPLPNNRLLPVNETFNIPEDCNFSKMDKQFEPGILKLKLPRNIVIPQLVTQQQTVKETKDVGGDSMTRKDEEETSTTGFKKQNPDKVAIVPPITTTIDEKSAMTDAKSDEAKLGEKKEENEANGKPAKIGNPENVVQNAGVKQEENKAQSKESAVNSATTVAKVEKKEKEKRSGSADAKGKEPERENINASAKKGIVKEQNEKEDWKSIINMGVSVLIIMGIGISILYLRS